jgi:hypothetical protein
MTLKGSNRSGKKVRKWTGQRLDRSKKSGPGRSAGREIGFTCLNCKQHVSVDIYFSGVRNRNHCPHCLYSRHVDLHKAGDRLAACKAKMRPIGLTLKQSRNKYRPSGEVMLIHLCEGCGKVSLNRIAADDLVDRLLAVFDQGLELDQQVKLQLEQEGIHLLDATQRELVEVALLGHSKR